MTRQTHRGLAIGWWILVACTLCPSISSAAAPTVRFSGPASCPTEHDFVAAVEARGASFSASTPESNAQVFEVSIREAAGRFDGYFRVRSEGATTRERRASAANCKDVLDALAVMVAIALHPTDAEPEQPPRAEHREEERDDGVSSESDRPKKQAPVASPVEPPELEEQLEPERYRGRSPFAGEARHRAFDVDAGRVRVDAATAITLFGGATYRLIPGVLLPRLDLTLRSANFLTLPDGQQDLLAMARVRVSMLGPATYRAETARTDIQGVSFGMSLCLSPSYDTRGFVLLACAEYGGGMFELDTADAQGQTIAEQTVGFGTVGLGLEAEYNIGSLFHVSATAGWDGYLGEIRAESSDGSELFSSPVNTFRAALGLGVHF